MSDQTPPLPSRISEDDTLALAALARSQRLARLEYDQAKVTLERMSLDVDDLLAELSKRYGASVNAFRLDGSIARA